MLYNNMSVRFIPRLLQQSLSEHFTVIRKMDMHKAVNEIRTHGMRPWAKGVSFSFRGVPYSLYMIKYTRTIEENQHGRYN